MQFGLGRQGYAPDTLAIDVQQAAQLSLVADGLDAVGRGDFFGGNQGGGFAQLGDFRLQQIMVDEGEHFPLMGAEFFHFPVQGVVHLALQGKAYQQQDGEENHKTSQQVQGECEYAFILFQ